MSFEFSLQLAAFRSARRNWRLGAAAIGVAAAERGEPGEVEFIAEAGDPDVSDLVEQVGGRCMIIAAKFGRVFVHPDKEEDLEFVARTMK